MTSYLLLQFVSIVLLAPFFDAFLKRFKALLNGRRGAPLTTYSDLLKLARKELLINRHSSFITRIAPSIIFAVFLSLAFFVPVIRGTGSINLIYLFYLFALGTFFLILYGMDSSTYFGGLGGARELFVAFLLEPILLVLIAVFSTSFGAMDIAGISTQVASLSYPPYYVFLLIVFAVAFIIVFLGENTRFPFDNPATHLELTMIHEAMLLETAGPNLALIEYAARIKLVTFMTLFLDLFLPFDFGIRGTWALWGLWFVEILLLLLALGKFETYITKLRIFRYHNYTGATLIILIIIFLFKVYFL